MHSKVVLNIGVITFIHEKCHVEQLRKYGKKYCQEHLSDMEKEAYNIQDEVFERLKKEVK